jgi:uncharacterized protein
MDIAELLKNSKVLAIVGCSRESGKYSNIVANFMKKAGYEIIPVNPLADIILDERCYDSLLDVQEAVDIVVVFRPSDEAEEITKQAAMINAKIVWLQEGIVNEKAKEYAEEHDIGFIQDKCIMKEHQKMQ